jgi:hypothetical protein
MGRKSKTQQLIDNTLGQQPGLSVAAHLARMQLLPEPLAVYDSEHMNEMIDIVARALAKVTPLYVLDSSSGKTREVSAAELAGAVITRAATSAGAAAQRGARARGRTARAPRRNRGAAAAAAPSAGGPGQSLARLGFKPGWASMRWPVLVPVGTLSASTSPRRETAVSTSDAKLDVKYSATTR